MFKPCGFHKKFTLAHCEFSAAQKTRKTLEPSEIERPFKSFIPHKNDNYLKEDEKG